MQLKFLLVQTRSLFPPLLYPLAGHLFRNLDSLTLLTLQEAKLWGAFLPSLRVWFLNVLNLCKPLELSEYPETLVDVGGSLVGCSPIGKGGGGLQKKRGRQRSISVRGTFHIEGGKLYTWELGKY